MKIKNVKTIKLIQSASCAACGRELTDPISQSIGIGPECIKYLKIDREVLASTLASEGLFEYEYEEGDQDSEKFHQKISEQRLVKLDRELSSCLVKGKEEKVDVILEKMELGVLSLDENTVISESRGLSLKKRIDKVRTMVVQRVSRITMNYYGTDSNNESDIIKMVDGLKEIITLENKYNSIIQSLSYIKIKDKEGFVFSTKDELHNVNDWCENSKKYDRRFFIFKVMTDKEKEKGVTPQALAIGYEKRKEVLIEEAKGRKTKEQIEIDNAAKKQKEDDFSRVTSSLKGGVIDGLDKVVSRRSEYANEIIERVRKEKGEFVLRYTPRFEDLVKAREWGRICGEFDSLVTMGKSIDPTDSQYFLLGVVSNPRVIDALNQAIKEEGRDWGSDLRRLYGKMMNQDLWGVATGKKKPK